MKLTLFSLFVCLPLCLCAFVTLYSIGYNISVMRKIILASASARRAEILKLSGLDFSVCDSGYQEEFTHQLDPHSLAQYLSRKKAEAVAWRYKNAVVIAADTFILFGEERFGKPLSVEEAIKILSVLNGNIHSVLTGFTIMDTGRGIAKSRCEETKVYFRECSDEEIRAYAASGEPLDKAGAYAIQGLGAVLIEKIEGDFFNVMGLPLCAVVKELKAFGIKILNQKR